MTNVLGDSLRSLRLSLDHHRSKEPSARQALARFLASVPPELARARQLGPGRYHRLLSLELACAEAGLGFPAEVPPGAPPWRIPSRLLDLSPSALPCHPLVDGAMLSSLTLDAGHHDDDAVSTLQRLVSGEFTEAIWKGLDRISVPAAAHPTRARVAVCLHLFYPDLWDEIHAALTDIPEPFDLYLTLPDYAATPALRNIAANGPNVRFFPAKNRGRDVLPFLRLLGMGCFDGYDAVCKLHSKRSPHMQGGAGWRRQIIGALLPEPQQIQRVLQRFRDDLSLGMLGPASGVISSISQLHGASNQRWITRLAARAGLSEVACSTPFFSGTMFWFRPAALVRLRELDIAPGEFPIEMSQTDGTPAHAIERLIWPLVEAADFKVDTL